MAVPHLRRIVAAWTALLLTIAVLGLMTSEGEPVCKSPFIVRVDDSIPPQCPSPAELLPLIAIAWAVGVGVILLVAGLVRARSDRT